MRHSNGCCARNLATKTRKGEHHAETPNSHSAAGGAAEYPAFADKPGGTYQFDTEGQHQFILFKISHLGYSWLYGNFNEFTGSFTVDEDNPENSKVRAEIKTASLTATTPSATSTCAVATFWM